VLRNTIFSHVAPLKFKVLLPYGGLIVYEEVCGWST